MSGDTGERTRSVSRTGNKAVVPRLRRPRPREWADERVSGGSRWVRMPTGALGIPEQQRFSRLLLPGSIVVVLAVVGSKPTVMVLRHFYLGIRSSSTATLLSNCSSSWLRSLLAEPEIIAARHQDQR